MPISSRACTLIRRLCRFWCKIMSRESSARASVRVSHESVHMVGPGFRGRKWRNYPPRVYTGGELRQTKKPGVSQEPENVECPVPHHHATQIQSQLVRWQGKISACAWTTAQLAQVGAFVSASQAYKIDSGATVMCKVQNAPTVDRSRGTLQTAVNVCLQCVPATACHRRQHRPHDLHAFPVLCTRYIRLPSRKS